METISALDVKLGSFRRHDRSPDYDAGYSDQSCDRFGIQMSDRDIFGRGVEKKLMFGNNSVTVVWENNSMRTFL